MKNRQRDPIFEFEGVVQEVLCETTGRFIFTFTDPRYTRILTFMLTHSVDHYRSLVHTGAKLRLKVHTKAGVLTSMMYPGIVEEC